MKKFQFLLLLIFLIIPLLLYAQKKNRCLITSGGLGYLKVRDIGMSPLLYSGLGYLVFSSYEFSSEKKFNFINFNLTYGKIKHTKSEWGVLHNGRVEINYTHLRNIANYRNTSISIGGSFSFLSVYRYQPYFLNSAHNYEIIHSLGLTASINHFILIDEKPLNITCTVNTPVISAVIRPSYASPLPEGLQTFKIDLAEAYIKSVNLLSLRKYIRLNNVLSANYPLFKKHIMRLSYGWEFYRINTINPVIYGENSILLSVIIKLK